MTTLILILTATSTALIAGLLYGYTCSVNPGLGRLPANEYLAAMQSINNAIQNPIFFASFMGTMVLLPLSAYLQYHQGHSLCFILLIAATAIYITGVFGVTAFGNVPLNEALDKFNLTTSTPAQIVSQKLQFEQRWQFFHNIRTIAAIISLVLVIISCCNSRN
ncbi:MAG: anthrone oxygenase family protein [Ferruginibacter sp.]